MTMSALVLRRSFPRACRGVLPLLGVVAALGLPGRVPAAEDVVDTVLIVSVDVSNSVDDQRYRLQMDGIANALADPGVISAILSGPHASILFSMIEWADKPVVAVPWTRIASKQDALALSLRVRKTPRHEGEFTCMARMMRFVSDKIQPTIPVKATRVVMDVSGDGIDNCNGEETTDQVRDELVASGMIINGLPIHEGNPDEPVGSGAFRAPGEPMAQLPAPVNGEPMTLEPWYRKHVIGGPGSFVLPAYGYDDFGRAIRQKFVVEVSAKQPACSGSEMWCRPIGLFRIVGGWTPTKETYDKEQMVKFGKDTKF